MNAGTVDTLPFRSYGEAPSKSHTLGHHECPACIELRNMLLCSLSAKLSFAEAAEVYMRMRQVDATPGAVSSARYIKPTTLHSYREYITTLNLFFAEIPLESIHLGHLRTYQLAREAGAEPFIRYRRPHDAKPGGRGKTPCRAKPAKIKQELGLLVRVMRRANAWSMQHEEFFEHLKGDEPEVARALTPEEQYRWLEIAGSRERWTLVHWWSIVAFDTTCSTNELRSLRIGDINLDHRIISVPWAGSKNRYRHRSIPIENADCMAALEQLLLRARDLGSSQALHYLFPFRPRGSREYDPTRPMTVTGMKSRWDEVREATGLTWFRQYDARHTGGTRLAEMGVPADVIMARMGHSNERTRQHYMHVSMSAQRRWLRPVPQAQPPAQWWTPGAQVVQKKAPSIAQWTGTRIFGQ